jgi:hypothetical protein
MRIYIRTVDYPITKYEKILQKYGLVTKYESDYSESYIEVDTLENFFKISKEIKKNLIVWTDDFNEERCYSVAIYDGYIE